MGPIEQLRKWRDAAQGRKLWFVARLGPGITASIESEDGRRISATGATQERAAEMMIGMLKARGLA